MTVAPDPVMVTRADRAARAVFDELEPDVRRYSRTFPVVFNRARGAELCTEHGRRFVDMVAGAGALNYGHNNIYIKRRVLEYINADGIVNGLDLYTVAKREFLKTFNDIVLRPRGLDFKVQVCGLTAADAVEAALSLARKATGRRGVIAFPGDMAYPQGPSTAVIEHLVDRDIPAAILVEPVDVAGGVHEAPAEWLAGVRMLADRFGILLIFDETRTGSGRTGPFFGFEHSGVRPDIVILADSVGGYGMPLSLLLFRRDLAVWQDGEHAGALRGNQLAFVAATAACELWDDPKFRTDLVVASRRAERFRSELDGRGVPVRGRGMLIGIDLGHPDRAEWLQRYAFDRDVLVDRCGGVVLATPPLCIDVARIDRGLSVLRDGLEFVDVEGA
ncbi:aminotransferase class III-fold pyridoxal phosphate-dependent enzyme [Actinocrispum sp. NPDC049592]|uniref:aminotransferase class III-fold pyridoxal phosphate-dependent enzyme n=1 Tax=Actinocrispum sp. NPDC049592 TaxID=3154835 RepID=UPI00341A57C4